MVIFVPIMLPPGLLLVICLAWAVLRLEELDAELDDLRVRSRAIDAVWQQRFLEYLIRRWEE